MNNLNHVGIIMDGNRRWAKERGLLPIRGHDKGAEVFENTCKWCIDKGVPHLTVYAFSTENWKREIGEVSHIFDILRAYFLAKIQTVYDNGIQMKVIGERNRFDKATLDVVDRIEANIPEVVKLTVQIALSYGGRDEITRAARRICAEVAAGKIEIDAVTEDYFESRLDTKDAPDVDLVIRTGGKENRRLSNFLPWQTVYAELYFSDLLWPDFSETEFDRAIEYFNSIPRKLGK
jgi:undecaprenyl diphosphate synthase